jgi:hypothetical protein
VRETETRRVSNLQIGNEQYYNGGYLAPFADYGAKLRPIIAAMEARQRKIRAPPLNFVLGSSPDFTSRAATDPPVCCANALLSMSFPCCSAAI